MGQEGVNRTRSSIPAALAAPDPEIDRRRRERRKNPGVSVSPEPGPLRFEAPHADDQRWIAQITDAFGSNSPSVAQMFLRQLSDLCGRTWNNGRWEPDQAELVGILGIINSVQPKNELQAALAAQMVSIHLVTMRMAARLCTNGEQDSRAVSLLTRLASTFAAQTAVMETMSGRRGRQRIEVSYERHDHKHVHVERGTCANCDQPHAPKVTGL